MKRLWLIALLAVVCTLLLSQVSTTAFTSPVSPVIPPGGVPTQHAEFYSWCCSMCEMEFIKHPERGPRKDCLTYCRRTALENCSVECRECKTDCDPGCARNCGTLYGTPTPTPRPTPTSSPSTALYLLDELWMGKCQMWSDGHRIVKHQCPAGFMQPR